MKNNNLNNYILRWLLSDNNFKIGSILTGTTNTYAMIIPEIGHIIFTKYHDILNYNIEEVKNIRRI